MHTNISEVIRTHITKNVVNTTDLIAQAKLYLPDTPECWYVLTYFPNTDEVYTIHVDGVKYSYVDSSIIELAQKQGPLGMRVQPDYSFDPETIYTLIFKLRKQNVHYIN